MSSKADDSYGYAECYPGMVEMNDAIGDSDDEADFSKMDLVRRNTFVTNDTPEN